MPETPGHDAETGGHDAPKYAFGRRRRGRSSSLARTDPPTNGRYPFVKLVWARPAREDRKTIREYIAADNPTAAIHLDDLFSENAARLVDHPGLGRPGRVPGTRGLVAHKNYILIYDLVGDDVRIVRVLHATRLCPPELTPELRSTYALLPARDEIITTSHVRRLMDDEGI